MPNPTDGAQIEELDVKQDVADSSPAGTEGVKGTSMLEAMQAALTTTEESPASTEQDPEATASEDPAKADETDTSDEDGKDLEGLSPKAQERFRKLVDLRRQATTERDAVIAERDTFARKATGFDQITGYMSEHRLNSDDVDNGFRLMALVRNRPEEALRELMPIVRQLQQATGHDIPADLQDRIRQGFTTESDARELSEARALARLNSERAAEAASSSRQREAERRLNDHVSAVTTAADTWHAAQAAKDPDHNLKQRRIAELVELELRRKPDLPNPAQVPAMLDAIKRDVDAEFRQFRPRPTAVTPISGGASPSSKPEPKSMLEAMKQAI